MSLTQEASTRSTRSAYALGFLALALAVALRWALDPLMGDALPLVTLFGAVAAGVWLGGYRLAIPIALLGYVACHYLFIPPRYHFDLTEIANLVGLVAYLFTCSLIVVFGEATRIAESRAHERHEVFRVTLRSIGDAVITTDTDGHITDLNEVAETLTGWHRNEALGQPLERVFNIVNEVTRRPVDNPAHRALSEGVIVGLANHTVLIKKDGSECPIDDSAAPIRNEHGYISGCVLIFRDVTAQRLRESDKANQLITARLLAAIVESSNDAIISKSLQGIIQTWNAAAERLFGFTADEAVGRHISLVIPPDRIAEEDEIIASLKAGKRIEHFETERMRKDGRRITVSLTISPIKDDSGNVVGASKIVRDVSEQKQMMDDLQRLAADLSAADQRKNEFLATLAHELRNPLAPMSNMLEVLKRADNDGEILKRAHETIERQLNQMIRLVDDLLDMNRITHDRLELRRSEVELESVIQQAVEVARPLIDAAHQELIVQLPKEPVYLNADRARLAQVFGNLLNNSCKYTKPNGRIALNAKRVDDEVLVTVRDNGAGIPPDKLGSIFDMFMQVDRSSERSQGGLGIGLRLVKRLVEMHGGSIEARSEGEGLGSEFIVHLLVVSRPAATLPAAGASPESSSERRVMIVDDNIDSAESLSMLLEITGNKTLVAHDGIEALEGVEKYRPEVILLDIGLPKLDGHEVCRRVRELPWAKDIVIIALTGWGQEDDRRKSEEAGFNGHLVKPVDYDRLLELLGKLTNGA
ncbi:MAG TPA: PAS domain S-box protein [Pyrinomonadaceae bacterium]|nr:PAS domain S-box protein [Pyrinomonadaceae bacterium]